MRSQFRDSIRRTGAVIQRELTHVLRDRRGLTLILVFPLIQLFLFAYAVKLTADHLPTAVVNMSPGARSQAFLDALSVSGFYDYTLYLGTEAEVVRAIDEGRVRAGVIIPADFAAKIERGDAQVLVILDGSDSFSVQSGYSAATAIAQAHSLELVVEKLNRVGSKMTTTPIQSSVRVLYNPTRDDLTFVMPGIVGMILQVMAVNLTAQSVVREREMGTIEQLLATPIRPVELMVGKLVPNILVAMVDMLTITLAGVFWFGVPFKGNPWLFAWMALLFVVSGLGLGLLISTIVQTRNQAQQLTSMLMLLSQLLTGFIYPRAPMPAAVRAVGNLIPLTYFIRIARGIITKGVGIAFLWSDVVALLVYGGLTMALAAVTFRKRLD